MSRCLFCSSKHVLLLVLLCLAVQAGNFSGDSAIAQEELEALWTNVKVILAGLQAYGQMWDGIDMMACKLDFVCLSTKPCADLLHFPYFKRKSRPPLKQLQGFQAKSHSRHLRHPLEGQICLRNQSKSLALGHCHLRNHASEVQRAWSRSQYCCISVSRRLYKYMRLCLACPVYFLLAPDTSSTAGTSQSQLDNQTLSSHHLRNHPHWFRPRVQPGTLRPRHSAIQ
jgi:hypothetical protein